MIVTGLLARALDHATSSSPGFEYKQVVSISPGLAGNGYSPVRSRAYLDALQDRLRALPGVQSVALALSPPLGHVTITVGAYLNGHHVDFQVNHVSSGFFETMSIPVAIFSAAFVTVIEVVGSVLVILGALLSVVAACYLVVMVGAAVFVHIPNGIFVADNGWELVGAIAGLLLALAAAGSGRYGLDHAVRARHAREDVPGPELYRAYPAVTAPWRRSTRRGR